MLIITAIKMPKVFPDQSHSKMSGQSLLYQGAEMMAEPLLPCRSYNTAKPNGRESGSISSTVPRGLSPCGKSVRYRTARGNGASTVLLAPAEGWL